MNVTCCRNDVAENFSFYVKQQSFTHSIQVSQLHMAKLLIIPECLSSSRTLLFSFLCSVLWIIVDICPRSFCELFCLPFHLQLLINFLVSSNFPLLCFIKQEFINPKARLASLYCIEVHVPSTENERSCVCVGGGGGGGRGGLDFVSFYVLAIWLWNCSNSVIFFVFHFIRHVQRLIFRTIVFFLINLSIMQRGRRKVRQFVNKTVFTYQPLSSLRRIIRINL